MIFSTVPFATVILAVCSALLVPTPSAVISLLLSALLPQLKSDAVTVLLTTHTVGSLVTALFTKSSGVRRVLNGLQIFEANPLHDMFRMYRYRYAYFTVHHIGEDVL